MRLADFIENNTETILTADAKLIHERRELSEEVFGPSSIVFRCDDVEQMYDIARGLDCHLTATIQGTDAELVEHAKRGAGEVAELGVVALALELGDHHHREHDLVLLEPFQRPRVGQQDRGVQDVRAARRRRVLGRVLGWRLDGRALR